MLSRSKRFSRENAKKWLVILGFGSGVAACIYIGALQVTDNFHVVVPDEVYRSGQLEPGELAQVAWKYRIKSVINLRGLNSDKDWYRNEVNEARFSNVRHINFKMNSGRELSQDQTLELIRLMRDAPKPLLIHCQGGADRSGLAAALYVAAVERQPISQAGQQLSLLFGHLPSFGSDQMCESLDSARGLLN